MSRPSARWFGSCDDCGAVTIVDGDGKSLPVPDDWDKFPSCLVCGETLHMDEELTSQWERESWLMRSAGVLRLDEFVQWVATNRAYNGAEDPGQALYNDGLNTVLQRWAAEFLDSKDADAEAPA